jgi:hypothetical protein
MTVEPRRARGTLIELFSRNDGDVEIIAELAAEIERSARAAALREVAELREALRDIVDEADVYRKDETTPECWGDSGPYCGKHSFLEYSPLIDKARAILTEATGASES